MLSGTLASQFVDTIISESSSTQAEINVITISLKASVTLSTNTDITITDLKGSGTVDTEQMELSSESNVMYEYASWNQ